MRGGATHADSSGASMVVQTARGKAFFFPQRKNVCLPTQGGGVVCGIEGTGRRRRPSGGWCRTNRKKGGWGKGGEVYSRRDSTRREAQEGRWGPPTTAYIVLCASRV